MEILSAIIFIINALTLIRFATSTVMCVYGYKWRRGLISITSLYIGLAMGTFLLKFLLELDIMEVEFCLIISLFVPILFSILAYEWVRLNHFLIGFITSIKLLFMLIYGIMDKGIIDFDIDILFSVPIIIGIVVGTILSTRLKYAAVILCLAYIGSVDLVINFFDLLNKGLFVATGDISYIFDIEGVIMQLIGVDIPSLLESVIIFAVTIISFICQSSLLQREGIDLSDYIIDDRNQNLID
jgi:membrane protein|nr:MAG TPA: protein of unknown function (DUF4203) [Caudoviricetes sp.]